MLPNYPLQFLCEPKGIPFTTVIITTCLAFYPIFEGTIVIYPPTLPGTQGQPTNMLDVNWSFYTMFVVE